MSIIKLAPSVKCYNWGGEKLRERFGLQTDKKVAQSWVLSALEGRESELITSKYAGMLFSEYLKAAPAGVLGTKGEKYPVFPLAVKFSDNQENSIVQVNPDTDRSSLWYVVGAGENSVIYFGMADEITQVELLAALSSGNLGQYLRAVPVKAGSVFRVDPGIVYAYGSEVQLLEMDVEAPEREMSREEVLGGISLQPVEQDFALGAWAQTEKSTGLKLEKTASSKLNSSTSTAAWTWMPIPSHSRPWFSWKAQPFWKETMKSCMQNPATLSLWKRKPRSGMLPATPSWLSSAWFSHFRNGCKGSGISLLFLFAGSF